MSPITPTIGRKVWFRPMGCVPAGAVWLDSDQPMDATIVFVWSDTDVNLLLIDHAGCAFPLQHVFLRQPGDAAPTFPHAEWMPYQVGQAKAA